VGKLIVRLIALGLLILALGSVAYMNLIDTKTMSDSVAMFFLGICLLSIGSINFGKKKQ
jgi:hypothetical protein